MFFNGTITAFMKKNTSKSIEESLREFGKISESFDSIVSDTDFQKIYRESIKHIAESPLMFNGYHWVTNFKDMSIMDISGLKKILGYDEETFTLQKSVSIMHPNFRPFILEYAKNAYEMLCDERYRLLSNKAHYSIQFPVLRYDGVYILVQMNISIIMVDKMGNPLVNYNRFEVLGNYLEEPIAIVPRVFFRTEMDLSAKAQEAEVELKERVKGFLFDKLNLTDTELKVLNGLSDTNKKIAQIAQELDDMSIETLKIHNKNILKKARHCLSPLFRDAKEVVKYLKSMDML